MAKVDVLCPECSGSKVVKFGLSAESKQRWLWHATDHNTHEVLAYHFGPRKDSAFRALQEKPSCFDINFYYTDDWGAYERNLTHQKHLVEKQHTQAVERKHFSSIYKTKTVVKFHETSRL